MIRLGLRLSLRSGRESATRLVLIVAGVAVGVLVLLATLSLFNAFQAAGERPCWECTRGTAPTGWALDATADGALWNHREVAYALADANAANLRAADEWLAMAKAGDLAQPRAAQDTHQGMPFVHTLATDAGGTAYFADASVVPHVTDAKARRCGKPSPMPGLEAYVLDGSTSACLWGKDRDAVVPGIFGPANQPRLTRADYVANSNNTAWMTNPSAPLTGYPGVWGEERTDLEPRPRVSLDMIAQRLSGADGLGAPGFTLDTLQATVSAKRNHTFELMRADLAKLCRAHPTATASDGTRVNVREACATLRDWDGRATLDGQGAILWREFFTGLRRPHQPGEPEFSPWRVPFDPAQPTPCPPTPPRRTTPTRRPCSPAASGSPGGSPRPRSPPTRG
ncbi:penicillin acylase family protein [Nonomuraea cavernae]|uniref:penicillin acylase family protein n=1 Tax=Nonomuraea cavernae TaxID=2045107 RepID=UPI0033F5768D